MGGGDATGRTGVGAVVGAVCFDSNNMVRDSAIRAVFFYFYLFLFFFSIQLYQMFFFFLIQLFGLFFSSTFVL